MVKTHFHCNAAETFVLNSLMDEESSWTAFSFVISPCTIGNTQEIDMLFSSLRNTVATPKYSKTQLCTCRLLLWVQPQVLRTIQLTISLTTYTRWWKIMGWKRKTCTVVHDQCSNIKLAGDNFHQDISNCQSYSCATTLHWGKFAHHCHFWSSNCS